MANKYQESHLKDVACMVTLDGCSNCSKATPCPGAVMNSGGEWEACTNKTFQTPACYQNMTLLFPMSPTTPNEVRVFDFH